MRSGLAALASPQQPPIEEEDAKLEHPDPSKPDLSKHGDLEATSSRFTPGLMFKYLKSTADAAQKKLNPTLKELSKAEDAADAYLNKLGASFGQLLRDVVTIDPPDKSPSSSGKEDGVLFDAPTRKKRQVGYDFSFTDVV